MMKKSRLIGVVSVIFWVGPALTCLAEDKPEEAVSLGEIVVTATKTEKKVEEAPGSVTVVTKEDIERLNIKTVDDALSELSGLFVKRSKGLMDSTTSVRLRGFGGDEYTAILLDGQPLNDAYTGGVEWGMLPVDNIERIEVIRGPVSALYGGNAMGGAINIITKTPEKLEARVSAGYGTHETRRYRLSCGDRFLDKLSLRIGYEEESTDGYVNTPVLSTITSGTGTASGGYPMDDKYGEPTKWVVGDKGRNGALKHSLDGRAVFDFSDTGNVSFSALSGKHEYDYGPPHTYMGNFGDAYAIAGQDQRARFRPNNFIGYTGMGENETDIYSLSLKEVFGRVEVHAQTGLVLVEDRYTLEPGSVTQSYFDSPGTMKITENESWVSELRGDIPVFDSHLLTVGLSYRKDKSDTDDHNIPFYRSFSGRGDSTFYAGGDSRSWAAFIQEEWKIIEPVSLYLGGRYDAWKVFDGSSGAPGAEISFPENSENEFCPKAAVVWKAFSDTTVRGSAGHAFRPPNLYELYRTWVSGTTTYESNPNLKPETVWAYEIGVDQHLFDGKTSLSLTGYRNDIEDLIYYMTDGTTKTRMNAGESRTYGLELEASQKIWQWFTIWGNFTYTNAKIIENATDPESEHKLVPGIPKKMFNIGLDTDHEWFRTSLIARYYSKIYNDSDNGDKAEGVYSTYEPSFTVDGKLTVNPWKYTDISFSVNNIFDDEYYEYYKTDGRTFFCEVTMKY